MEPRTVPLLRVYMSPDAPKAVIDVLLSGFIGEGERVKSFEKALCAEFNWPHVLAVNSCTSALQLALRLAGVGHGDLVLSTPATNMATNSTILAMGAKPYWVDLDSTTGRVDPFKLPHELPENVKALMVMDWGGTPCDYKELYYYTSRNGIKLIVDSAHSLGAVYAGKFTGSFADFTCFSFQAVKHVTTGDGGALVCKDEADHKKGRLLRWFGIDRDNPTKQSDLRCEAPIYDFGYKFHMNDIAASIGLANFEHVDEILGKHRSNAAFYDKELAGLSEFVRPVVVPSDRVSSYWLYTIRVLDGWRDQFAEELRNKGVACSKVHSRNDEHPCMPHDQILSGVDAWYRTQLSIPVGSWVTEEDRQYVVQSIKDVVKELDL